MTDETQRPAVLTDLSASQMDSIGVHISNNDQIGYMRLAESYGWNSDTRKEVWSYMSKSATTEQAQKAFEDQGGQPTGQTQG